MWNRVYYQDDRVNINPRQYHSPAVRQRLAEESAKATLKKDAIKGMLKGMKDLEVQAQIDERIENKRFYRLHAQEVAERQFQENIQRMQVARDVRAREKEQEECLARELERRNLEKARDESKRRQVREESQELRDLEAKLREAYTLKERMAQMAEKQALRYDELKRDAEIAQIMKEQEARAKQVDDLYKMERFSEKFQYKQGLERQLEEQEIRKQQAYEEHLKERLMVDEMVRKMYEEDQREQELKRKKQELLQSHIKEYKKAREFYKKMEEERMRQENMKIAEYNEIQEAREAALRREHDAKVDALEAFQQRMGEMMQQKEKEREELEQARLEIAEEEQRRKDEERDGTTTTNKIKRRIEMRAVNDEAMNLKKLKEEAERQEEAEMVRQMLDKFAEDERIENLNKEERRQKQLEFKRAAEAQLVERRRQKEQQDLEKAQEDAYDKCKEDEKKRVVEEERLRLLREHAPGLLGYLPKGVIRDAHDIEMLGEDFRTAYLDRTATNLDEVPWEPGQTMNRLHRLERLGLFPDPYPGPPNCNMPQ